MIKMVIQKQDLGFGSIVPPETRKDVQKLNQRKTSILNCLHGHGSYNDGHDIGDYDSIRYF